MIYFLMKGTNITSEGSLKEISEETGRTESSLRTIYRNTYGKSYKRKLKQKNRDYISLINEEDLPIFLDNEKLEMKEFYFYKGDELICHGNIEKISEITKTSKETLKLYTTPAYKKMAKKSNKRISMVEV